MRWILWLLAGLALVLAILLATAFLGLARLNPWLARRLATGSLAAGLLRIGFELGIQSLSSSE
ncbi:MAG TPA: hypothetical protein VF175_09410 [Lacipirellula sp.]